MMPHISTVETPLMPEELHSEAHTTTLGRAAVFAMERNMAHVTNEQNEGEPLPYDLGIVSDMLQYTRKRLVRLNDFQASNLDDYLEQAAPGFLQSLQKTWNQKPFDQEYPGNGRWARWLANAPNGQLLNFLQWHNDYMEIAQGNPILERAIETQKANYKRAIRQGVKKKWLHPDAAGAIELVDETKVFIGDVFELELTGVAGYHVQYTGELLIADGRPDVIAHELNHACLGEYGDKWLNEAITEHIAQVMRHGKVWILWPEDRRVRGSYVPERELLEIFLTGGEKVIPIQLLTRRYSARTSQALYDADVALEKAIIEAYGDPDILKRISNWVTYYEKQNYNRAELTDGLHKATKIVAERYNELIFEAHPGEVVAV